MRITFLGTGTSVGVPSVGCECTTCLSDDPRDNRLRTSVLIEHRGQNILIDASTDFRQQALRIGGFAYVTDCNLIPDETCARLMGLDLLVIDALRFKKHPTHMTLDQSLGYIDKLKPHRALLTHISHDIKHAETSGHLPEIGLHRNPLAPIYV